MPRTFGTVAFRAYLHRITRQRKTLLHTPGTGLRYTSIYRALQTSRRSQRRVQQSSRVGNLFAMHGFACLVRHAFSKPDWSTLIPPGPSRLVFGVCIPAGSVNAAR